MSQENFEKFRQIVLEDLSLQEQLRAFTENERDAFMSRVVELGAERGFEFSVQDVHDIIIANRRAWLERWM